MTEKIKVFLVGRHGVKDNDKLLDQVEIVASESVQFGASSAECKPQTIALLESAKSAGADAVLFQAVPGQLAALLIRAVNVLKARHNMKIGIVISVPGERPPDSTEEWCFTSPDWTDVKYAEEAVNFVQRGAAKTLEGPDEYHTLRVTAASRPRFQYSHIEWL